MQRLVLAALAGATLLGPALADEGAGTNRSNFYLELARDQARLRNGGTNVLSAPAGNVDAYARSPTAGRRPARPRR